MYAAQMYGSIFSVESSTNTVNISSTRSLKKFEMYYGLCLDMAGNVNSVVFYIYSCCTLHFSVYYDTHTVYRNHTSLIKSNKVC